MGERSTSENVELRLVRSALQKNNTGQKLTGAERESLKRWERKREEEQRWAHYHQIPQKHWREMSGRQAKQLREQAERYAIPFGGKIINLPEVVRALHSFLASKARILARSDEDDLYSGFTSPAMEKLREATLQLKKLELGKRRGELLDRHQMHDALTRAAGVLRRAGERLERRCGSEAYAILDEALDGVQREFDSIFAIVTTQSLKRKPRTRRA